MDATRLTDLNTALEQRRSAEAILTFATGEERTQVRKQLTNLNKRIGRMQVSVTGLYSTGYIDCRDVGHRWEQEGPGEFDGEDNLVRTLTCPRCFTQREDTVNDAGWLVRRRYVHQDDYRLVGSGQIGYSKSFWRGLVYMQSRRPTAIAAG